MLDDIAGGAFKATTGLVYALIAVVFGTAGNAIAQKNPRWKSVLWSIAIALLIAIFATEWDRGKKDAGEVTAVGIFALISMLVGVYLTEPFQSDSPISIWAEARWPLFLIAFGILALVGC